MATRGASHTTAAALPGTHHGMEGGHSEYAHPPQRHLGGARDAAQEGLWTYVLCV